MTKTKESGLTILQTMALIAILGLALTFILHWFYGAA
jgi:hypothetical protein